MSSPITGPEAGPGMFSEALTQLNEISLTLSQLRELALDYNNGLMCSLEPMNGTLKDLNDPEKTQEGWYVRLDDFVPAKGESDYSPDGIVVSFWWSDNINGPYNMLEAGKRIISPGNEDIPDLEIIVPSLNRVVDLR